MQRWEITGPRVLDIGEEGQRVERLKVQLVGGQVDVVTQSADEATATVQVSDVSGPPLQVSWDGRTLTVEHRPPSDPAELIAALLATVSARALVSICVPPQTRARINTATASVVASALTGGLSVNTVSGRLTLEGLRGKVDLNTVSGPAECAGLDGPLCVNTVSGAVTVQASRLPSASLNSVSGEVALDLRDGHADLSANSVSGHLTVRAPFTGYAVQASATSGQVVVDGVSYRGREARSVLRSGDESLSLRAHTVSGDVVLLHANGTPQDAPSAPPGAPDAPDAPDAEATR